MQYLQNKHHIKKWKNNFLCIFSDLSQQQQINKHNKCENFSKQFKTRKIVLLSKHKSSKNIVMNFLIHAENIIVQCNFEKFPRGNAKP